MGTLADIEWKVGEAKFREENILKAAEDTKMQFSSLD